MMIYEQINSGRQRKRLSNTSIADYFSRRRPVQPSPSPSPSSTTIPFPIVVDPSIQDLLFIPSPDSYEPRVSKPPQQTTIQQQQQLEQQIQRQRQQIQQIRQIQPPPVPLSQQRQSQQQSVVPLSQQRQSQQRQSLQRQSQQNDDEIINLVSDSDSDSSQDIQPSFSNNHTSDFIIDITDLCVCLYY